MNVTFPPCRKESLIFLPEVVHMFSPSSSLVRKWVSSALPKVTVRPLKWCWWIPRTGPGTVFGVTWRSYNHFTEKYPLVTTASQVWSISPMLFCNTGHRILLQGGKSPWPKLVSFLVLLRRVWQKNCSTHLLEFLVLVQRNGISE